MAPPVHTSQNPLDCYKKNVFENLGYFEVVRLDIFRVKKCIGSTTLQVLSIHPKQLSETFTKNFACYIKLGT